MKAKIRNPQRHKSKTADSQTADEMLQRRLRVRWVGGPQRKVLESMVPIFGVQGILRLGV